LRALETHLRRSLRRLLQLQADTTGVDGPRFMEELSHFHSSGSFQVVIENLQTAEAIIEQKKNDPGCNRDHLD